MVYPTKPLNLSIEHKLKKVSLKSKFGMHMKREIRNLALLKYLEDRGVTLEDMIETVLELFVSLHGVETREKAIEMVKKIVS